MRERPPPYAIFGPCPCAVCGTLVWWARGVTRLNGVQVKGTAWWRERTGRMHRHTTSRARAKRYNNAVEYSDPIAHTVQRPAFRLYSEARGVDVPEYRRNA
jgi:hypothetical protein